ncbi:Stress responsive A/B Barrel Domain protein [compost metagenome]
MTVQSVVIAWLKEPHNEEHIAHLTAACERLRDIPGVREVRFGPRAELGRPSPADSTFDFGTIVTFDSLQAARDYGPHPLHQQAAQVNMELVERFQGFYFET